MVVVEWKEEKRTDGIDLGFAARGGTRGPWGVGAQTRFPGKGWEEVSERITLTSNGRYPA